MLPNLIRKHSASFSLRSPTNAQNQQSSSPTNGYNTSQSDLQHTQTLSSVANDPKKRSAVSMTDIVTKSGQLLTSIQGTLDKQLGQIAEAVHIGAHDSEFFSPLPAVATKDFESYIAQVREHWSEYHDICSSLIKAKEAVSTPATEIDGSESTTNAFREIPQVFFNSDYRKSGFEQHQIFTQPIRISIQNQGKINSQLASHLKTLEQHLVKHLSNVDGLLHSLLSIAVIQSDIAIAQDRVRNAKYILAHLQEGEVNAGLKLMMLVRRRARVMQVLQTLDLVEQVAQAKPGMDSLLKVGDFGAATDLVQATRAILSGPLAGIHVVDRVAVFIEEHGRSIDNVIEVEFADLVVDFVLSMDASGEKETRIRSMVASMATRQLLVQSLQGKLNEVLARQARKEIKGSSGIEHAFDALHRFLGRVAHFLQISVSVDSSETARLHSLKLFEAVAASGLARVSQDVPESLREKSSEEVGKLEISDLKEVRSTVVASLGRIERLYMSSFADMGIDEYMSFSSSVTNSPPQNGCSPDVEGTLALTARQRLWKFHEHVLAESNAILHDEKWDKSGPPSSGVTRLVSWLEPPVTLPPGDGSASDGSPIAPKFVKLNKVNYILVASAMPIIERLGDYLMLALAVPGVAVDSLSRLSAVVRAANTCTRELVLEGKMSAKHKKAINATNLALSCQLAGMLAQLIAVMGKRFCEHYRVENGLVAGIDETPTSEQPELGAVLTDDPSAALNELLMQVVMELNDHRMDVFIKLGDILIGRFDFHMKYWFAIAPQGASEASPMEGVVKDFTQMYKVLLKSLQTDHLKRIFSRALSESAQHYSDRVEEIAGSSTIPPKILSEFACKFRIDILFLYQNLLAGDSMAGVRASVNSMVQEMVGVTEERLPLIDRSVTAEQAFDKVKQLLRDDGFN